MKMKACPCTICQEKIDPSACGQFLAQIGFEDDAACAPSGKTIIDTKMYLCPHHSRMLHLWVLDRLLIEGY